MEETITKKEELKQVVKEAITEAIREERISIYETIVPTASKSEVREIEELHGKPEDYDDDYVDMTDAINYNQL